MKKLILLLVLTSLFSTAQEKTNQISNTFAFKDGVMNNEVVINIKGVPKGILFKRTQDYVKKNYADYNAIVLSETQDELIKLNSVSPGVLHLSDLHPSDGLYYIIQIEFKDEKIKITNQSLKMITENRRQYQLENPLKEVFSSSGITYNFSDVPVVLNKNIKMITDYLQEGDKKDNW